jgi:hypothetical protein
MFPFLPIAHLVRYAWLRAQQAFLLAVLIWVVPVAVMLTLTRSWRLSARLRR